MSYTYNPGARPDALSILRDKGLLDTPARMDPKPGTFVLSAAGHFRIGDDGRAVPVPPKYPVQVAANDALPVHAFLNLRALGWALVTVVILAALLGLLTVGAK
jgi:hypothetical protein